MKGPKVTAVAGCGCLVISLLVLGVSLLLPALTDGRTSWDEAMLGIVPGALCSTLSFLILVGGLIWLWLGGRKGAGAPKA
jgi:hypothetical protein